MINYYKMIGVAYMNSINRVFYTGVLVWVLCVPVTSLAMIVAQDVTKKDKGSYNPAKVVLLNEDLLPQVFYEKNAKELIRTKKQLRLVCRDMAQQFPVTPSMEFKKLSENSMGIASWQQYPEYYELSKSETIIKNNRQIFTLLAFSIAMNDKFTTEVCMKKLENCSSLRSGYELLLTDLVWSKKATYKAVVRKDIFGLNENPVIKRSLQEWTSTANAEFRI